MEPFFHTLEATYLATAVRQSLWMFPIIECFHLLALALLGGTVLAVDMRLLGVGLQAQPASELARKLQPWMAWALATCIVTGVLMFLSEAIKCYFSPPFWYKMTLLLLASLFAFTIRRRVALAAPGRVSPVAAKLTALVSLGLWLGVGFSGRWIAFY